MTLNPFWQCVAVACLCLGSCVALFAQDAEPDEPASKEADSPAPPAVQEAETRLYYLPDEKGVLRWVPGFTLKDFDRMVKIDEQQQVKEQEPKFAIAEFTAAGVAEKKRASLKVTLKVVTTDVDWVRIPLQLGEAVLQQAATSPRNVKHILELTKEGYVCWLKSPPNRPVTLSLDLLVRIDEVAEEHRLNLTTPTVPAGDETSKFPAISKLTLEVPLDNAAGRVTGNGHLTTRKVGAKTELKVVGLQGQATLAWWKSDRKPATTPAVLDATGSILIRVEGRAVRSEANLNVTSIQGPFDSFRVRLPEQTKLAEKAVVRTPEGATATTKVSAGASPVIEVTLSTETRGPVDVRLVTERLPAEEEVEAPIQFAGFDVLGAAHQSGHVAFRVVGDWKLLGEKRKGLWPVEVEELPKPLNTLPDLVGFEYFSQPFSFTARIARRQPRVSVEPQYYFEVHSNRIELEARLQYVVHQVGVWELEIDLPPDWRLYVAQLEPADLIDLDSLSEEQLRPLVIPLKQAQIGRFEVVLRAWKPLSGKENTLALPLPAPRVNSLGPARVVVQPADNVDLSPRQDELVGLSPEPVLRGSRNGDQPLWQQKPFIYRTAVATAKFVAGIQIHPQETSYHQHAQVMLKPGQGQVQQDFHLLVQYEPVASVLFLVPEAVGAPSHLRFRLGKELVPSQVLTEKPDPQTRLHLVQVSLAEPSIGEIDLSVEYPITLPKLEPASGELVRIPLIALKKGTLLSSRLSLEVADGTSVEPQGDNWTLLGEPAGLGTNRIRLTAKEPQTQLSCVINREAASRSTRVPMAWIQSWIGPQGRRDRLSYRVETIAPKLVFSLPAQAEQGTLALLVNQTPVRPEIRDGQLEVMLPPGREAVNIEIVAHYPAPQQPSQHELIAPQLPPGVPVERTYWEVVLPGDQFLGTTPPEFTPEFVWQWTDFYWSRQPLWSTAELESWVGVRHEEPGPPESANRYLFSSLGSRNRLPLQTIGRAQVVLVASGGCLVIGLALIYWPPLRRWGFLFALGVATVGLGFLYPGLGPLFGQAAVLGVGLVALAAVLQRTYQQNLRRGVVVRSGPSSISSMRTSTLSRELQEDEFEQGSTATASMAAVQLPAGEREG